MDKKCIFIGGKPIGIECFRLLIKKGVIPKLVIANPGDTGKDTPFGKSLIKAAKHYKIKTRRMQKGGCPGIVSEIKRISPEIIFCIGSTFLLSRDIVKTPKLGCLNIHPSLLPKYRGRYSNVHSIFNGEKFTGVTLHWIDEGIDSGPIISQKRFKIGESDTAKDLYRKYVLKGGELFCEFIEKLKTGKKIISRPQDEKIATYYHKALPNNGEINWNWSGAKIKNFIRAMTFEPYAPAEFCIGNKKMIIVDKTLYKYKS